MQALLLLYRLSRPAMASSGMAPWLRHSPSSLLFPVSEAIAAKRETYTEMRVWGLHESHRPDCCSLALQLLILPAYHNWHHGAECSEQSNVTTALAS